MIYGENPGSKLSKAQELNIKIIDEKNSMRFLINYKIEVFLFKKLTKSPSFLIIKVLSFH